MDGCTCLKGILERGLIPFGGVYEIGDGVDLEVDIRLFIEHVPSLEEVDQTHDSQYCTSKEGDSVEASRC